MQHSINNNNNEQNSSRRKATHMTLWLFSGCPPDLLKKVIVTCIRKNPQKNKEYSIQALSGLSQLDQSLADYSTDDKQQTRWIPSSEGLCDCIRLQLERSDLIEIVLLLGLLRKHANEFVNRSFLALTTCGNIISEKGKRDGGKELAYSDNINCVMHGLILSGMLIVLWFAYYIRSSLRARRGTLYIGWVQSVGWGWSAIVFVRMFGWENKGKKHKNTKTIIIIITTRHSHGKYC